VENFCYDRSEKFWFTNRLEYVEYFRQFTRKEICVTADPVGAAKILKHVY